MIAAVLAAGRVARADDREPAVTVRALAFAGLGETRLTAGHYGAASVALGLEAAYWFAPGLGVGLRLGTTVYVPFDPGMTDAELSHDDDVIEPELVVRRTVRRIENGVVSLQGSAGLGIARVRTMDSANVHVINDHLFGHPMEVSHADAVSAAIAGCIALRVHWVELSLGARLEVNRGGDWAIGPDLALGGVF